MRSSSSVAEDARPFAEGEVGREEHRGLLVQSADQIKQLLATALGERQIQAPAAPYTVGPHAWWHTSCYASRTMAMVPWP